MPSGADKIKAILRGAAIGFVAVVILLLVPVIGVRKGLEDLVANWQELALYASCLLTGTLAGARLALNRGSIYEDDDAPGSNPAIGTSGDSRPEPELINFEDAVEQSLAGEPKKRRLGPFVYYFHHDRERTLALLASLYVILYVNCAALCQKMHLGIIVAGDGDTIMRSLGVVITFVGLSIFLRGVMRTGRQIVSKEKAISCGDKFRPDNPAAWEEIGSFLEVPPATSAGEESSSVIGIDKSGSTDEQTSAAETPVGEGSVTRSGSQAVPSPKDNNLPQINSESGQIEQELRIAALDPHRASPFRMEGSRLIYASVVSHIPPTRFRFITRNPICLGALLVFSGLPLVFHAWFPLVAIPGIFIVMSWMFSGDRENHESLVVQGQQ